MILVSSSVFGKMGLIDILKTLDKDTRVLTEGDVVKQISSAHEQALVFVEWVKDETLNQKLLRALMKRPAKTWAILDPYGLQQDPASLFHLGAFDYLGPEFKKQLPEKARLKKALGWAGWEPEVKPRIQMADFDPVKPLMGKDYRFCFLLVDFYKPENLRNQLGDKGVALFRNRYKNFLEKLCQDNGGVLWIQQEFTFLVAFSPKSIEMAVFVGLKLLLSRSLHCIEVFDLRFFVDLRVSMHIGTAPWQPPGRTGQVVSDSINSLFHLGMKRTPANAFSITEDCRDLLPPKVKNLFQNVGEYEGRQILQTPVFLL